MKDIIIWSKDNCVYCDMAKQYFDDMEYEYEERKIGHGWTKEMLQQEIPDATTVPQIIIDDVYIGGYIDLIKFIS